jgi:hypothetical protein
MTLAPVPFSRLRCWIGRQAAIDNDKLGLMRRHYCRNLFHLP